LDKLNKGKENFSDAGGTIDEKALKPNFELQCSQGWKNG
jgi:hypothetical protein